MDFTKLAQLNEENAQKEAERLKHSELLLDNAKLQETIVKSFSMLVGYLDKRISKTEVINQLEKIGTPDVQNVVTAVENLHKTLKTHENTDLTEITKVMQGVLDEVKLIPKDNPELPEQKFVDYSKQLKELETAVKAIEKAVKAQELSVEAPVVNLPETVVNVEKPDLKPIEKSITTTSKDVVKAVKGIKIPELDTNPIEKLLKKTNKLLEELPELIPTGGGGAGRATPYQDSNDVPAFVELEANGSIPITEKVKFFTLPYDEIEIVYTDSTKSVIDYVESRLNSVTQQTITLSQTSTTDNYARS